jgi:hypothetical protein
MGVGHSTEGFVSDAGKRRQEYPVPGLDRTDLNAHFFITVVDSIFSVQDSLMLHRVKTIYCPTTG